MKASLSIFLLTITLLECTSDADLRKIATLEVMVKTEKIFASEPDGCNKKRKLAEVVKLYECVDNKDLFLDENK